MLQNFMGTKRTYVTGYVYLCLTQALRAGPVILSHFPVTASDKFPQHQIPPIETLHVLDQLCCLVILNRVVLDLSADITF